jgi:hypothetical protein
MSEQAALKGTKASREVLKNIKMIDVDYYSMDGKLHRGQLQVHKDVVSDIKAIFKLMREIKFPVAKAVPIAQYGWSDDKSMADNNTSSFNFRYIAGTNRMSKHATGIAIDINPFLNPVVYSNGRISPKGAKRDINVKGTFHSKHPIVKKFKELGWKWGGDFKSFKDYHHFAK